MEGHLDPKGAKGVKGGQGGLSCFIKNEIITTIHILHNFFKREFRRSASID